MWSPYFILGEVNKIIKLIKKWGKFIFRLIWFQILF